VGQKSRVCAAGSRVRLAPGTRAGCALTRRSCGWVHGTVGICARDARLSRGILLAPRGRMVGVMDGGRSTPPDVHGRGPWHRLVIGKRSATEGGGWRRAANDALMLITATKLLLAG
jgi:hypothetical protein